MAENRKIAAILAADVVGFSRLAGADEDRTLARLRALRSDLIDPTIAVHNGRVVKRTGDGALVEFRSVVDAVRCAIEVQNAHGRAQRRRSRRSPHRVPHRHPSGRRRRGERRRSDGRRRQYRRAAGGHRRAGRDLPFRRRLSAGEGAARSRGHRSRRRPNSRTSPSRSGSIRFRSALPAQAKPAASTMPTRRKSRRRLALPDKPSIAVLPFQNMSGDPEQEYFADGMVEDIITGLSRIKWLFVIARNSSFVYKGKAVDMRQVGRELGVRYVLEGGVRKAGNRLRITGAAHRGRDRRASLGRQIRRRAGGCVRPAGPNHGESGRHRRTEPAAVGDRTLPAQASRKPRRLRPLSARCCPTWRHSMPADARIGAGFLEDALKLDPNYAAAHALLAYVPRDFLYAGRIRRGRQNRRAPARARRDREQDR